MSELRELLGFRRLPNYDADWIKRMTSSARITGFAIAVASILAGGLGPAPHATAQDEKAADPNLGSHTVIWFSFPHALEESGAALRIADYERAAKYARRALDLVLEPGDRDRARNNLCAALVALGELKDGIVICEKLVTRAAVMKWPYYNSRGNAYLALARYGEAIDDYKAALRLLDAQDSAVDGFAVVGEKEKANVDLVQRARDVLLLNIEIALNRKDADQIEG